MKARGFHSAATVHGSAVLPFVISTGAQRSGEIFVWRLFPESVFRLSVDGPAAFARKMKMAQKSGERS
jgi:hypothetical protein